VQLLTLGPYPYPGLHAQVEHEGKHRSCCAVVKGLQRSMFFVPAPGVLGGDELARLEAAAAAAAPGDAAARGELLRHLHVRWRWTDCACLALRSLLQPVHIPILPGRGLRRHTCVAGASTMRDVAAPAESAADGGFRSITCCLLKQSWKSPVQTLMHVQACCNEGIEPEHDELLQAFALCMQQHACLTRRQQHGHPPAAHGGPSARCRLHRRWLRS